MSMLAADGSISDPYQNFIATSRYARYIDAENRRETWTESVDRFMDFMTGHLSDNHAYEPDPELVAEVRDAIANLEIVPSMRAVMTAGEALERSNIAGYNCSYLPIDDLAAFSEVLFILLNGTGVGFSVEKRYIDELPPVPRLVDAPQELIVVGDSKLGWAHAYRMLIEELWLEGWIPRYDLSAVRPAGARLQTFGGRASGPEPLRELFEYTVTALKAAQGRQLTSLEVHDLVCKIASVVVVGGVRRSAMISLSDLNDPEMAAAKSGEWWTAAPHRALANNSAVYEGKITREQFDAEWGSLVASGSGERGIFNRTAAQNQAAKNGRRDRFVEYGTNPCSEIIMRPFSFCNLSEVIVRPEDSLESIGRKVRLATILGTWQSTLTDFPFLRPQWAANAREERLLGVSLTGVFGNPLVSTDENRAEYLGRIKRFARVTNMKEARAIGIPSSHAVTCVKPSGTVSQLAGVSSGIHPWHAKHYLRTVRADKKDPLAQLMKDSGVPCEDDVMQPDSTWVFSFPIKAPNFAVTRDSITAIQHLELWLDYQRAWCEHKPSVTISVRGPRITNPGPFSEELAMRLVAGDDGELLANIPAELDQWLVTHPELTAPDGDWGSLCDALRDLIDWESGEWDKVGDWVFAHLDELSGVSFLPHSDHVYKQAPYQEITRKEYQRLAAAFPEIRWADLPFYELTDSTTGAQELACVAGACDVVDLVTA
ncbi:MULTISPECIES: hypothetical protein [Streptosporangium]|uniref:Ribonucleoside-diphosphate reductase alpha chain n=1 Tax=Streptosporangium brasiliense TaxID=47480 RepID=A0ABT9RMC0_9ACTN|nr:hypothetical protein [Streptosporangium brasiliense]MDP9870436.1 ribonucleoside-diphosphate reductase alpha chain [Streptosporangium brasiliense]